MMHRAVALAQSPRVVRLVRSRHREVTAAVGKAQRAGPGNLKWPGSKGGAATRRSDGHSQAEGTGLARRPVATVRNLRVIICRAQLHVGAQLRPLGLACCPTTTLLLLLTLDRFGPVSCRSRQHLDVERNEWTPSSPSWLVALYRDSPSSSQTPRSSPEHTSALQRRTTPTCSARRNAHETGTRARDMRLFIPCHRR